MRLTPTEFQVLLLLASHPGCAFSRDEIIQHVTGVEHIDTRTVDVHIRHLRAKLEEDPCSRATCTPSGERAISSRSSRSGVRLQREAPMFRSFRTQLVVSFFLVIPATPLLFISLFYGPFGRYLRSGNTGSSLPYHARVIGNLLQEVLATGTSVDDLDHLLRMAAKGTPYRFVLIDRDRQVMVDTGVAPGSALPTNPARAAEYGRPLAPDGRPAMHRDGRLLRAAASIDVEGEHLGVLLVSRYSQRPSSFSPSTFIPRIILGLVIAGILACSLSPPASPRRCPHPSRRGDGRETSASASPCRLIAS